MTIGRPQGAVWIGKPMDVVIPLTLDAAEADGSLCLQADVLQGDSAIPDRRVTVSLEQGASGARMRVRSTVPIEEPVVTLNVRAGCDVKSTRNYALLADVPVDAALPAVAAPAVRPLPESAPVPVPRPIARAVPRSTAAEGGASGPEGGSPPARRANPPAPRSQVAADAPAAPRRSAVADAAAAARRTAATAPAPAARATPPAAQAAAPEARQESGAGRPRLQVEALEPAPALAGNLKASPELNLPDAPDPARRAAAAALWSALDPAAEEAQREAKRTKDMEATLAALREQAAQNQRTLLEMRSELAQARESRYANPLVYALVGLLLLALIGMLMLWRLARRTTAPAWWGEASVGATDPRRPQPHGGLLDDEMELDSELPRSRRGAKSRTFGPTPFAPLDPHDDDDDLDSGPHAPLPHPAQLAEGAPVRPVNTEELFDVQQQSDFFLSLGQHDQAIAVLREHIAANPGTSALAYLDLLRIFHSLDREDDYAHLAEEFERAFNADVPSFEHFTETGKGLEHYRSTLARIEALWPAPGTLALIEELVFRKPGRNGDGAFDLAAYQELLLLYSVAKEVIDPASAAPAAFDSTAFADTIAREWPPTATAPMEAELPPPAVQDGPVLPPSIYGSIDQGMHHETVMDPEAQLPSAALPPADPPAPLPDLEMDLGAFDKTAYETMPSPIESPKPPTPSNDPHVIDFDLFDPSTEAEIAPRPIKR